jgi:nitroreductase/NAD-dependent dihydropyrimidine dehydrogenase PreA subunit
MLEVNTAKCTGCGICIEECRSGLLVLNEDKIPQAKDLKSCNLCGHCVAICPTGALVRNDFTFGSFKELPGITITPEIVRDLLLSRRSTGIFKERPVPREMIEQLITAGTHAGTATNAQFESFIVIQDKKVLSDLEDIVLDILWNSMLKYLGSAAGRQFLRMLAGPDTLQQLAQYYEDFRRKKQANELRGAIFRNTPAVVVAYGLRKNPLTATNCALALRNMEILALPMGLGTCWAGFLIAAASRKKTVARFLKIPDTQNIYGAIMVGFPKHVYKKMIPRKERAVRWI